MRRLRLLTPSSAARVLLLVGIAACPSVFDLGAIKPFDVPKVAALWFFTWLAFTLVMVEFVRGRLSLRPSRLGLAAGAFLAATGISTLFSHTRLVSFFGWYGRYNGFEQILLYVVAFFLVTQLYWRRPDRLREIFYALSVASAVLTGYILVQWLGVDPIHWLRPNGGRAFRVFGTMGNSNFAGGFLGATMAVFVFAFWRARSMITRAVVVIWALITAFALWQTSSRGGLIAAAATAFVAVVVFRARLPRLVVVVSAVATGAVLVAALGAILVVHGHQPSRTDAEETPGTPNVLRSTTLEFRTLWWRSAIRILVAHPIVGAGPDSFIAQYPRYAVRSSARFAGAARTDSPHNIYLEHAASLGILGIGSYLLLIVLAYRLGLRRMKSLERADAELLGSFLALLSGYLAQGFFSIDVAALAMVGWLALAGIAAIADPSFVAARAGAEPVHAGRSSAVRLVAVALTGVLGCAVVAGGLTSWLADRAAKQGQNEAKATASTDIALRSYRRAISLAPYDPVYRGLAGNFLASQAEKIDDQDVRAALLAQAVEYDKQMDALQPGVALWKTTVGQHLGALGAAGDESAFDEAVTWFDEAEAIAHQDTRVPTAYGAMLVRWGQTTHDGLKYCEAISQFRMALALRHTPEAWTGLGQALGALGHIDDALAAFDEVLKISPESSTARTLSDRLTKLRGKKVKVITCR
jgi:O-antigen ligase/Flp pilus assembly protein TadD